MKPGEHKWPMEGLHLWLNEKNGFLVFELLYKADPAKRDPNYIKEVKESMPIRRFKQEYELQWETFEGLSVFADWDLEAHGTKANVLPHIGLPLLLGFDFGLCYSEDTEVLTDNGWKLFPEIDIRDKLATLNPQTFELEYHHAKFRTEYPYKGKMLQWDSNSLNVCVTPEHVVPYSKRESPDLIRWESAQNLSKQMSAHRYVQLTAKAWEGANEIENPMGWDPVTFAQFMGMYLSEGSIDKKYNRVCITQIKPAPEFQEVLDKTGLPWVKDERSWRVSNKVLADYLRPFGTQEKRFIPKEIRMASRPIISEFIALYTQGDGHIRNRPGRAEEHTIFTCSKRMAADFQDIALKMGWTSSETKVSPTDSFYEKEDRIIHGNGGFSIRFKKTQTRAELFPEHFSEIDYDGMIYCVSVPHHTLYVRRNGRPSWNGNTPACLVGQLQEDTLVIFREFTAINMGAERFMAWLTPQLKMYFPKWQDHERDYICFIDPSGMFRKDTDEGTCAGVIDSYGFKNIVPGPVSWEKRKDAVEHFLTRRTRQGPGLKVCLGACPVYVRGFQGGYRYDDRVLEKEPEKLRPKKDIHSHVHDAGQMMMAGILMMKPTMMVEIPILSYSRENA